ncbi:MAG: hypothetical protein ACOY0T_35780 [Myxococcota bacterium]
MRTLSLVASFLFGASVAAHVAAAPAEAPAAPGPAEVPAAPAPSESAAPAPTSTVAPPPTAPQPDSSAAPMAPTQTPAPPPAPTLLRPPVRPMPAPIAPARAEIPPFDDAGVSDDGSLGSHQTNTWIAFGVRTTFVRNAGFDVFAKDDVLTQASFALGRVVYSDGPLSFAAALGWDVGSRSAAVRGASTALYMHRFTLSPEVRYHLMRRLYAFGRVGAGGALVGSSFNDPVTERERSRWPLLFTVDASAGAAYEVLGHASGQARGARGWLLLDAGYLFTTSTDLVYANEYSSPARAAPIALGDLGLHGLSARLSGVVTF